MPGIKRYILIAAIIIVLAVVVYVFPETDAGGEPPASADENAPPEVVRTTRLLEPGTVRETTLFIITSADEGPTIMVIGGVHGDEPAGYLAADIIATWSINRGTLLVLPRANIKAVATGTRFPPGTCNLNRSFPGNAMGNPTERLALSIYQVMEEFSPQWVVDLHEAQEFEKVQDGALGQTIIYPTDALSLEIVEQVIEGLNQTISEELHRFQVVRGGVQGGTLSAARSLGLDTLAVETTRKLPLDERIDQQLSIVRLLISALEIKIFE